MENDFPVVNKPYLDNSMKNTSFWKCQKEPNKITGCSFLKDRKLDSTILSMLHSV